MSKNTYLIKENYKKVEEVREIDNQVPSYEEFMKNYEGDERVNNSYENEIRSYGDIGVAKGCGPVFQEMKEARSFLRKEKDKEERMKNE